MAEITVFKSEEEMLEFLKANDMTRNEDTENNENADNE